MRSTLPIVAIGALAAVLLSSAAQAEPRNVTSETVAGEADAASKGRRASADEICRALVQAAVDNELPVEFFTRLIWQESRFDPSAVSSKGALGIAQFMPGTASARGLADPLEPLQALRESASYLRELRTTFRGNLGLAAAAYNAGPGRVEGWLAGRRTLPGETRAYVRIVTGHTAEEWASQQPPQFAASDIPKGANCVEVASLITTPSRRPPAAATTSPAWGPWGVQLAGNWSEGKVLASYEQLRRKYHAVLADRLPLVLQARVGGKRVASKHILRVSESSRAGADALCGKLRAAGGACIVLRNPPS
jgi:hypothetical protein